MRRFACLELYWTEKGLIETAIEVDIVLQGGEVSSVTFHPNDSSKVVSLEGDKAVLGGGEVKQVWIVRGTRV